MKRDTKRMREKPMMSEEKLTRDKKENQKKKKKEKEKNRNLSGETQSSKKQRYGRQEAPLPY